MITENTRDKYCDMRLNLGACVVVQLLQRNPSQGHAGISAVRLLQRRLREPNNEISTAWVNAVLTRAAQTLSLWNESHVECHVTSVEHWQLRTQGCSVYLLRDGQVHLYHHSLRLHLFP